MNWRNTENDYGRISKFFHWLLFALIAMMIIGALSTEDMPEGPEQADLVQMHKSLGAAILLLVGLRLLWRLLNNIPALPASAPPWQRLLAKANHYALYAAMLAQPISGILMSQAEGHAVAPFNLFTVPTFVAADKTLAEFYGGMHGAVWMVLIALVVLHVIAAFYHHWGQRDPVLRRMWFG